MKKVILAFLLCAASLPGIVHAQNIGGIGAGLFLDTTGGHTMPQIQNLVPGTAADQYLKATDYIIIVNGTSCLDKTLPEVVSMIRGEVGTTVKITVADTKEGKRPREYDLVRGSIAAISTKSIDPVEAFNELCENEVKEMKKRGIAIVKTFPSDCGNYFFNFDAEAQPYRIRVMVLDEKNNDAAAKTFYISARVFDNTDEKDVTEITKYEVKNNGGYDNGLLEGTVTFKKACIGVVNVLMHDEAKKCRAIYVVICK